MPFGKLKFGFGLGGGGGAGAAYPIDAPILAVVTPVTNPPDFNASLPVATSKPVVAGDVIVLVIGGVEYSHTITAPEIIAGTLTISSGPLAVGSYSAYAYFKRSGVRASANSNTVTFDISSVAGTPIGLLLALTKAA